MIPEKSILNPRQYIRPAYIREVNFELVKLNDEIVRLENTIKSLISKIDELEAQYKLLSQKTVSNKNNK
jgi:predicted nuclease with TOPRIM domain